MVEHVKDKLLKSKEELKSERRKEKDAETKINSERFCCEPRNEELMVVDVRDGDKNFSKEKEDKAKRRSYNLFPSITDLTILGL